MSEKTKKVKSKNDAHKSSGSGKFVLGAIAGAVAGAVAGVLFAPKSGKETRGKLQKEGQTALKEGKTMIKKASKDGGALLKKAGKDGEVLLKKAGKTSAKVLDDTKNKIKAKK